MRRTLSWSSESLDVIYRSDRDTRCSDWPSVNGRSLLSGKGRKKAKLDLSLVTKPEHDLQASQLLFVKVSGTPEINDSRTTVHLRPTHLAQTFRLSFPLLPIGDFAPQCRQQRRHPFLCQTGSRWEPNGLFRVPLDLFLFDGVVPACRWSGSLLDGFVVSIIDRWSPSYIGLELSPRTFPSVQSHLPRLPFLVHCLCPP